MKIRLRPGADIDALKEALREGGAAEVLKLARSMGTAPPVLPPRPTTAKQTTAGRRESDCYRKTRYHDEAEAKRQKRRLEKKRSEPLRAYSCPFCHGWHLTRVGA